MNLMRSKKVMMAILILSSAIIGVFFTFNLFSNSKATDSLDSSGILNKPIEWASGIFSADEQKPTTLSSDNVFNDNKNLTQSLGENIFSQVQASNGIKTGLLDNSQQSINSMGNNVSNNILGSSLSEINLINSINNSDLNISYINIKSDKVKYFKNIADIKKKDFGDFKKQYMEVIVDVFQKKDPASAKQLADIYKNISNDLTAVSVPSDFIDLHKEQIIYFKNSEIVYRAMANYEQDPIKGYMAMEMIDQMIKNAADIQTDINKKVKELNSK